MKRIGILFLLLSLKAFSQQQPFWKYLNGPEAGVVNEFKKINGELFLCCNNGLYKFNDSSSAWEHLFIARLIHFDGTDNGIIFSVSEKKIFKYDLSDNKLTVQENPDKDMLIVDICISPQNEVFVLEGKKYASYPNLKIFSTKNYGEDWQLYESFDKNIYGYWFWRFDFNSNGRMILIGLKNLDANSESTDIGIYFKDTLETDWRIIKLPISAKNIIFLGNQGILIWDLSEMDVSTDFGQTWQTEEGMVDILDVKVVGEYIYAFTVDGILKANKNKRIWEKTNNELFFNVQVLDDTTFIAYNNYDIMLSRDLGYTWEEYKSGYTSANIKDIKFDQEGNIYALFSYVSIYKSNDNGQSWVEFKFFRKKSPQSILIADNGYIFVGTGYGNGFFRSTDNGETWENLGERMHEYRNIDKMLFTKKGTLLTNTPFSKINRSTDYGETWESIWSEDVVYSFSESPDGNILAGGERGLIQLSTDDGLTWQVVIQDNHPLTHFNPISDFEFEPDKGSGYAISTVLDAYSKNNYKKWSYMDNYQTVRIPGRSIALDSIGNLWMCYETARRSTNDIDVWDTVSSGLMHDYYTCIETSPDGYIFLGTDNGGLYRSRERYVSVKEEKPEETLAIYSVPNPASGSTEIHYTCTAPGEVNISIRDILGREYASFNAGYKQPGSHSQHFNTSSLPPGIYFILIESAGYRSVGKMIVEH